MHHRLSPRKHRFEYGIFLASLDLDELEACHRQLRLFSHNASNLYEFRDSDHFIQAGPGGAAEGAQSLKERVLGWVRAQGVDVGSDHRVQLITLPRVAGYIFNPVSFYFITTPGGTALCAVAEVGNTFGEQKAYLVPLSKESSSQANGTAGATRPIFRRIATKHFYVSPFSGLDLKFDFRLAEPGSSLSLGVNDLTPEGDTVLISALTGERRPLSDRELVRLTARYPLVTIRVITLIHWQALKLWLKRIPFFRKAELPSLQQGILHRPVAHR